MSKDEKIIEATPTKLVTPVETVGDTLKHDCSREAAFIIMKSECRKQQKAKAHLDCGYSQFLPVERIQDLLSPEMKKTRFVAFKEKFSEDMFFKKPELGKAIELPNKPPEFTNENFTYGRKTKSAGSLYELVLPNKTPHDVKKDFLKWHDKYVISHQHYLPSEKIYRNYNDHFNSNYTYGMCTNADTSGRKIKRCMQECSRKIVINIAQKKFLDRTKGELGKKIDRYNLNLDPDRTFGIRTNDKSGFDVRALIENTEPCAKRMEIIEAISHINNLRHIFFNSSDFHMYDLKTLLYKYEERPGFITINSIMKVLRLLQIHANERNIRVAVSHFDIIDENENSEIVSIEEFWKMLHMQYPLPRKIIVSDTNRAENKETSYRLLCNDREKPLAPERPDYKLRDYDVTTTGDLISPAIPMNYGLRPRDFEVLRPKEELERIFKRVLPQNFDQIWQFACSKRREQGDETCEMSANQFRTFIDEFNQNLKQ